MDDDGPLFFAGDGEELVGAGRDGGAAEVHGGGEFDLGGSVGAGAPDFAVGDEGAEDDAALGAGAGVIEFDIGDTDALLDGGRGAGGREFELGRSGGGGLGGEVRGEGEAEARGLGLAPLLTASRYEV